MVGIENWRNEAFRMELLRRGEQPKGFHENLEDVDVSHILIEQTPQRKQNAGVTDDAWYYHRYLVRHRHYDGGKFHDGDRFGVDVFYGSE